MKRIKNIFALVMTMIMTISMAISMGCTTVKAADKTLTGPFTITIDNSTSDHTYQAYQIFKGDLIEKEADKTKVLSNIEWGSGVDNTKVAAAYPNGAAKTAEALTTEALAKTFADNISESLSTTPTAVSTYNTTNYTIEVSSAGYYLIKDASVDSDAHDSYTEFILQVVGNESVKPKSGVPTVEKKVKENDQFTEDNGYGVGYNDVADWNIGDHVPFKLIGTLPVDEYASYETYKYIFTDTAGAGLTFDQDSVKAYVNDTLINDPLKYGISFDGQKMTVTFDDLKKVTNDPTSKIIIEYTATLNANAEIGLPGNENKVGLEFSNNPNKGGDSTGKAPEDKVIVFTYELDTTKVAGVNGDTKLDDNTKLAEAKFLLYKGAKGTPTSYAKVDKVNGKLTGWTTDVTEATTLSSAATTGLIKVIGLDDGTYFLKETLAPIGYNLLAEDVELKIDATTVNNQAWSGTAGDALTALNLYVDGKKQAAGGNVETGVVSTYVANFSGATLPSTGGIGTTIFYIIGAGLMVAAGVVLVIRKKAKKA